METLYEIAHVKLYLTDSNLLELKIEDTELFHAFDDILHEQFDIENYSHSSEIKNGVSIYTLYFRRDQNAENLIKAVKSIDEKEVLEIYKLNSK